ncbi:MAG: radical SAM protein [Planctomycetota bacterium]|nr:radical SAM protein [Planctomycetota bacterium]
MKILFVANKKNADPTERELYEMDLMNEVLGFDRSLLDLGLLTVLGATPEHIETSLQDEYLGPIDYDEACDLVAISAKTSCSPAAYRVADEFRRRGKKVVLGGIHASLRPEEALEHVDYIVTGEAETVWLEFLRDFEAGCPKQRYDAQGFPDMANVPHPSYANTDPKRFLFHQIQTTRGCPYMCRFCSVPDISGRAFRFKPVENVIDEILSMPRRGAMTERLKALYMVDDNFISRTRYTKELLEALVPLREQGRIPDWSAETTLNVAKDEDLLDLFQAAGCTTLIIGFESVSQETLKSMDKGINFCVSYDEAIENIHKRGISIVGNFIVGFDTDHLSVFRDTRDFILENNILYPFFSILAPMPGTELHEEFKREERLDHFDWSRYDTRHVLYEPKHMSREQLMDGYVWLYEQCYLSDKGLDNLARFWRRPERAGSNFAERAFIRWRLARSKKLTDQGRDFTRRALALRKDTGKVDMAQLLYYLDSGHFAEFLSRYKSEDYDLHGAQFEAGEVASVKQWDDARVRRSAAVV